MGRMTSHIPNSVGKSQLWLVESICSLVKSTHRLVDHVNIHVCWLKPHFFGFNTSFFMVIGLSYILDGDPFCSYLIPTYI